MHNIAWPIEAAVAKSPWSRRETNAREKDKHRRAEIIAWQVIESVEAVTEK